MLKELIMLEAFVFLLIILQLKHWYIDFVNQSMEEVESKGKYGDLHGILHSTKHGIGTMFCILAVTGYEYLLFACILGFIDFVVHYHVDWTKMNYGNRDIQTPAFWNHLGLDQMVHQITYILLAYCVVS
jgi:hypothetical protein